MTDTHDTKPEARVVVGIDGSTDADLALREAVQQAVLRGAQLEVVHVWSAPFNVGPMGAMTIPIDLAACEAAAREVLDRSVDGALAGGKARPPRVERILVRDPSVARTLLDTAKGADLLVVGSRGHGGFAGLLLGSVSQQCIHHASCPVMVVRAPAA